MMDKLVVDTCVFKEGFLDSEETDSAILLSKLEEFNARLVFSQETIGELLYILKRECNKLELDTETMNNILTDAVSMFQSGKSVNTRRFKDLQNKVIVRDQDDQMFVDLAFAAKASHLITLDRKSGILNLKNTPFICSTPKQYIMSKTKVKNK